GISANNVSTPAIQLNVKTVAITPIEDSNAIAAFVYCEKDQAMPSPIAREWRSTWEAMDEFTSSAGAMRAASRTSEALRSAWRRCAARCWKSPQIVVSDGARPTIRTITRSNPATSRSWSVLLRASISAAMTNTCRAGTAANASETTVVHKIITGAAEKARRDSQATVLSVRIIAPALPSSIELPPLCQALSFDGGESVGCSLAAIPARQMSRESAETDPIGNRI